MYWVYFFAHSLVAISIAGNFITLAIPQSRFSLYFYLFKIVMMTAIFSSYFIIFLITASINALIMAIGSLAITLLFWLPMFRSMLILTLKNRLPNFLAPHIPQPDSPDSQETIK